ncbi:hypothetical protein J2S00_001701 [Caldalkalibacillus uzonensis]|uniref:Nal1 N-terminal domain-containing protein n=1 Tax=Caldalkalibacillus uzonensis TaxID=353224 RepID=A0ABU0CR84_9BACI|nr:hypothetical protein [Caldalkalibacillus uzonensis]MDQ0338915.1 hypothetical protein [Caldalkalibacillus uzonensis]
MPQYNRFTLNKQEVEEVREAKVQVEEDFLGKIEPPAHVVGMGVGVKWKDGQATGEPSLLVFVTHKVDKSQLSAKDLIPDKLADMQTDVVSIGTPVIESERLTVTHPLAQSSGNVLNSRVRPVKGGWSVGHKAITAGTVATCVYELLPGARKTPAEPGLGIPAKYYILSNNHVLANSNEASLGDAILQPGPYDGGKQEEDTVAHLSRFIPIQLDPPTPRGQHANLVDAAIAEAPFHELDREIHWIGRVRGWRRKENVTVGMLVQKTGRTTCYTTGRIMSVDTTIDVGFGGGKVARFKDQIVTTNISAGGDSGSLVTTLDNIAIGLLFAGSAQATVLNQIENVRSLLGIEVAEEVL